MLTLVEACEHLRDRFLLCLRAETGMRVGQALGLRHCHFVSHRREIHIVPRADNANGARAKTIDPTTVPVSVGLVSSRLGFLSLSLDEQSPVSHVRYLPSAQGKGPCS